MFKLKTDQTEIEQNFAEEIAKVSEQLRIPSPDTSLMVKDALLKSDAFLRSRRPVIAITGLTHTGKSSLINALFGQKMLEEGLTSDTSRLLMSVPFKSGMLLYDTPGGGGTEAQYENVTRLALGIPQLEKDVFEDPVTPLTTIPTADATTYNLQLDAPKKQLEPKDIKEIDLILFVVSVESGLRGDDIRFFQLIASCKPPVIVVINKIDLAKEQKIKANIDLIQRKLARQAIPVSAITSVGLDTLAVAIQYALPLECARTLGETIDRSYRSYLKQRQIEIDSIVAAIMTAKNVNPTTHEVSDNVGYASNILGLYGLIVRQYGVSHNQLREAGLDVEGLWREIGSKMKSTEIGINNLSTTTLVGLAFGGLAATITAGGFVMLPFVLGLAGGGSLGATVGLLDSYLKRSNGFKESLAAEFKKIRDIRSATDRISTTSAVLSFGRTVRDSCESIERKQSMTGTFVSNWEREYSRAAQELHPFADLINSVDDSNFEQTIKQITSQILN